MVQIYGLKRAGNGSSYVPLAWDDNSATHLTANYCSVGDAYQTFTRAAGSAIEIDDTSGPVVGSLHLTFEDGSTFAGSFSVPLCASTIDEHNRCE